VQIPVPEYLQQLESRFIQYADPANAEQMKKYMKDLFEYYGVKSPLRKELYREQKNDFGLIPNENKDDIVHWCWKAPERDWQYFAMEFLVKEARKVSRETIILYEFMITSKSWWDTVDLIAGNLVGPYFQQYPDQIPVLTEKWMDSGNMWLQRTCVLFQLKYKKQTDTKLLDSFISRLNHSKEFFIRKAIGWALREYSKTDPEFVIAYVASHQLSGLSHREALKWLANKGMV
jgi:3-methyladenine DNA glycosylase AlkD